MSAPLYNRDILSLAVATAEYLPLPGARLDMHADRGHPPRIVGVEIEQDAAAAERCAQARVARRVGARQIFGGRHRERQDIAIVQRRAHFLAESCFAASASAARASARRSAITWLIAALVALSAG